MGQWDFVSENLYYNNDCSGMPLNCNNLVEMSACYDYGCDWENEQETCQKDEFKLPSQINLLESGSYSMLLSYPWNCNSSGAMPCQNEFGDIFTCNAENGNCEAMVSSQWGNTDSGELCLRMSFEGTDDWNCMASDITDNELNLQSADSDMGCSKIIFNRLIAGCMDGFAINYNSDALISDGSCQYRIYGCTDEEALNYNDSATNSDGSCIYPISVLVYVDNINIETHTIDIRYSSPIPLSSYSYKINIDGVEHNKEGANLGLGENKLLDQISFSEIIGQVCLDDFDLNYDPENTFNILLGSMNSFD